MRPDTPTGEEKSLIDRSDITPRLRRRSTWLMLGGAVVIAAALFVVYDYYRIRESTDDAQIDGHIDPVAARVGGTVTVVNIVENQYVSKDTVLVLLDPKDYQVALDRAKADLAEEEAAAKAAGVEVPVTTVTAVSQLDSAEAGLARAQNGVIVASKEVDTERARLAVSKARLREAEATSVRADQDLERMKLLIAKDEISKQEFDAAVAAASTSRAARDSAQAAVDEAEKAIEAAEARVIQARQVAAEAQATLATARTAPQRTAIMRDRAASAAAKVQSARADLERAQLNLAYTTIRAPVSGVVTSKNVEVGQIVQAGQPLLAVVPLDDIWVKANFKESQLKDMRPGQPVEISVDAYPGHKYRGYVESIAAATGARTSLLPPENATGNYVKVVQRLPVRIRFAQGQDPEHLLRPGMSVNPTVITGK